MARPGDHLIADLGRRQHGVVARRQLVALGFGKGAIDRRVATGRLHPVHRGVYAVGTPGVKGHGCWMAAVLSCGEGAVLSYRSAAALWDLMSAVGSRVDVTVPACRGRFRPGISLHRVRTLKDSDRAVRDGIPVTSLARTLLDLAEVLTPSRLAYALERAERIGVLDMRALRRTHQRSPGRRGLRPLGRLLAEARDPPDTRSQLERRFVELCRREGLPPPAVNVTVAGHDVDAVWPRERLIVELDGFAYHRTRRMFETDRVRDAELQLAGYRVLRITARRLEAHAAAVADTIRGLLR